MAVGVVMFMLTKVVECELGENMKLWNTEVVRCCCLCGDVHFDAIGE